MRLPVDRALPLAVLIFLGGCGLGEGPVATPSPLPKSGPAADYPMVIGDPFSIAGKTYTPADTLNWDEVGYAATGEADGSGVSAAHKTLPLPSYVEVTALDSGRTILVRIERRGPMTNEEIIELSPGAAVQLGIAGQSRAPVRVRRVNPPEPERALLRGGGPAPERMETPKGLLSVLRRKLEKQEPLVESTPAPVASDRQASVETRVAPATPAPLPATKPAEAGKFSVQIAAFSTEDRAKKAAAGLNAMVIHPGRFWLMRLGPFTTRTEAEATLAKARNAGYSDARILRAD
jgi:rare lipoprotein A